MTGFIQQTLKGNALLSKAALQGPSAEMQLSCEVLYPRTLAGEWARHGIRCNVVMPGFIATPKVRALPQPLVDALTATIPLARTGEVEELAGVVAFLLSPAAAYVNGAVIRVDGGFGLNTGGLMTGSNT